MEREKFDRAPSASIVDSIKKQKEDEAASSESQKEKAKAEFEETFNKTKEQLDAQKSSIEAEIQEAIRLGKKKVRIGASGSYTANFKGLDVTGTSEAALQATQKWVEENYGNEIRVSTENQRYPGSGGWPSGSADYLVLSW